MLKLLWVLLLMKSVDCGQGTKPVYTQVTFLYDIKRGDLIRFNRPFSYYLSNFEQLLKTESNLIVFGTKQLSEFVWKRRQKNNTVFVEKPLQTFRDYWYFPLAQKVRDKIQKDPKFQYKQAPQFALPFYNGIVFAKYYLMEEAIKHDKWNTDVLIWTDGGLMHVFPTNLAYPQNVMKKFFQLLACQWIMMAYVNHVDMWIGFSQNNQFPYNDIMREPYYKFLAGLQGGQIETTTDISNSFENLLRITLQNGQLNSQESVLTIMGGRYPFLMPILVKFQLKDFHKKIHNYESVRRITANERFWDGVMRVDGKLEVHKNKTLVQLIFKQEQTSSKPIASLQNTPNQNQQNDLSFKKLSSFLSLSSSTEKGINAFKFTALGIVFIIYIWIVIKNRSNMKKLRQFQNTNIETSQQVEQ